jgi:hypothetical protein
MNWLARFVKVVLGCTACHKSRVGRGNDVGRCLLVVGFSLVGASLDLMYDFACLSDTTTYSIWRYEPRWRIQRPEWDSDVDLCKIPYANFPEFPFYEVG